MDENGGSNSARSTPSGHYAAPTEAAIKRLAATRTVYDRTGAGMPLRDMDKHIDHVVPHQYEYGHHEMPHGHPQNYNYANHPNATEHLHHENGAPLIVADPHAPGGGRVVQEEFYEPSQTVDDNRLYPVPSRVTVTAALTQPGLSQPQPYPIRVGAPAAPLTRTMHMDADDVMAPSSAPSRRVIDLAPEPTQEVPVRQDNISEFGSLQGGPEPAGAHFEEPCERSEWEGSMAQREAEEDALAQAEAQAEAEAEAVAAAMREDEEAADRFEEEADVASVHSKALSDAPTSAAQDERNAYDEDTKTVHVQSPKGSKTLVRQHTWNSTQLAEQLLTGVKAVKVSHCFLSYVDNCRSLFIHFGVSLFYLAW